MNESTRNAAERSRCAEAPFPVFGICGYSGSGKTTLIEAFVPRLRRRGLTVGVIKHDAHGLDLDREGKDSDRFFRAGADVLIRDAEQMCLRVHGGKAALPDLLTGMGAHYDLILVEGYKATPLDMKIWLCGDGEEAAAPEAVGIRRALRRDEDRVAIALRMVDRWLPNAWRATPIYAGILIGGKSSRMGRPKHLIETAGTTWLEKTVAAVRAYADKVVLLGGGDIPEGLRSLPVLPDVEDARGPLRGMLAAMRWAPLVSWVFLPCDTPFFCGAAMRWLLRHRRPGVWAVMPLLPDGVAPEPLPGYYDFRAAGFLERARGPSDLAAMDNVAKPMLPSALTEAWTNINTPEALERI